MTEPSHTDYAIYSIVQEQVSQFFDDLEGRSMCLDKLKAWAEGLSDGEIKSAYLNHIEGEHAYIRRRRDREIEQAAVEKLMKALPRPDWAAASA